MSARRPDAATRSPLSRRESQRSLGLAVAVIATAVLAAFVLISADAAAGWVGGVAAVLIGGGVLIPHRGVLGLGTIMLALGSLVATDGRALEYTLGFNALFAMLIIAVLVGADVSYVTRRATVVSPVTVTGLVGGHVIAAASGVAAAVMTLGAVLAITWPPWLLLVPAGALTIGSVMLVRLAIGYQRGVNLVPQARPPSSNPLPDPPPDRVAGPGRRPVPPPPRPSDRVGSPPPPHLSPSPRLPLPPPPRR